MATTGTGPETVDPMRDTGAAMTRSTRRVLTAVFTATGFSALTLQVTWQRVISLHAGVDLASLTTVIAAFLAGLGLGSLVAGWVADRLGPRRSLAGFAASNAAIGVFAVISVWLFYDVYRRFGAQLADPGTSFAFNSLLVVVPTALMGLSLPLLAKAVVDRGSDAGAIVGRLYAANTLGAAAGAMVAGWVLLGTFGFVATVRLAGALNLAAAVAVAVLVRRWPRSTATPAVAGAPATATAATPSPTGRDGTRIWPWVLAYSLTGAVALGLEQVFFRLVDSVMRSNSYSFGHVLGLYLLLFAAGSAAGSRVIGRVADPRPGFLRLQLGVGLTAIAGVVVLTRVLPAVGAGALLERYFVTDGFNVGFGQLATARGFAGFVFAYLLAPLAVMGPPVFLAGASYPFIQAIVTDRTESVGRRTGLILAANVAGNVAGTLLTGYVLIDRLGTSGTLRLLAASLAVAGVAALALDRRPTRTTFASATAVVALGGLVVAAPDNERLWAFLHGTTTDRLTLAEQRSCATTLKRTDTGAEILHINGSSQNGYPFDDFHVLIGLLPALAHPDPDRALAIGLGIGATAYGMAAVPEVGSVDVVELCGGQSELLAGLAAGGAPELSRLFGDRDVHRHVADGRKFLLTADEPFDLITVDTLRPQSAFSGSLYSTDFYELLRDSLAPGGVVAQWTPTARVRNSITAVFPHVVSVAVASYGGSPFVLASLEPIDVSPEALAARFASIGPDAFSPAQRTSLETFLSGIEARCEADGPPERPQPRWSINRDLAPRDEYFLNNPLDVTVLTGCGSRRDAGAGQGGPAGKVNRGGRPGPGHRAAAGAA